MNNIQLSLKKIWFVMTKSRIKTEDYRDINPYWAKRLLLCQKKPLKEMLTDSEIEEMCVSLNKCTIEHDYDHTTEVKYELDNWYLSFKKFDLNIMTLGYPKKTDSERILKLEHLGIEIGHGKEEWGAEKNKLYFIIKHGEIQDE